MSEPPKSLESQFPIWEDGKPESPPEPAAAGDDKPPEGGTTESSVDDETAEAAVEETEPAPVVGKTAADVATTHLPLRESPLPEPLSRSNAHLAVVFVHGMGSTQPGDTIERFMNPSLEWIKRAATHDHTHYGTNAIDENLRQGVNILERARAVGSPQTPSTNQNEGTSGATPPATPQPLREVDIRHISRGVLKSASLSPAQFTPPHLVASLYEDKRDQTTGEQVDPADCKDIVVVEAWWDGEFEPPPFNEVASWGLGVAPSLAMRQVALLWSGKSTLDANTVSDTEIWPLPTDAPGGTKSKKSDETHGPGVGLLNLIERKGRALIFTIICGPLLMAFHWGLTLLLLLGAVPFLKKYIASIILSLMRSLGDVLAYVHDGVRSSAIRFAAQRSFDWLFEKFNVDRLMVVGYSLGSVIAYDILNRQNFVSAGQGSPGAKSALFVTFGSPLKRANMLLHLMRDRDRISTGMGYAYGSLISAVFALASYAGWFDLHRWSDTPAAFESHQWWYVAGIVVGTVFMGIGAHLAPTTKLANKGLTLSLFQVLGALAAILAMIPAGFWVFSSLSTFSRTAWKVVAVVALVAAAAMIVMLMHRIASHRKQSQYMPKRMSQFATLGTTLIIITLAAGFSGFLSGTVTFLLVSLLFSMNASANPLEEFEAVLKKDEQTKTNAVSVNRDSNASDDLKSDGSKDKPTLTGFRRRLPNFAFSTPISEWVDFWATDDLVAEFGLADVTCQITGAQDKHLPKVRSRRVTNQRSYRNDHSVYEENAEQFIAPFTRLFLEGLHFRSVAGKDTLTSAGGKGFFGWPKISDDYNASIRQMMATRAARVRWLRITTTLLLLTVLLLSPAIFRSLGETIVFNQPSSANEIDAPTWFRDFYNPKAIDCEASSCTMRTLPVLPDGFSKFFLGNTVTRPIVVYGLGYGIAIAVVVALRSVIGVIWRGWEQSLLDRVLQRSNVRRSFGLHARTIAFALVVVIVMVLAVLINIQPELWGRNFLSFIPENDLSPRHTVIRFLSWVTRPL